MKVWSHMKGVGGVSFFSLHQYALLILCGVIIWGHQQETVEGSEVLCESMGDVS